MTGHRTLSYLVRDITYYFDKHCTCQLYSSPPSSEPNK